MEFTLNKSDKCKLAKDEQLLYQGFHGVVEVGALFLLRAVEEGSVLLKIVRHKGPGKYTYSSTSTIKNI